MSLDIALLVVVDTGGEVPVEVKLFDGNYTHNVTPMWKRAGCYDALYHSHGKTAGEILSDLEKAVQLMESNPDEYKELNPPNGWGNYETALEFLKEVRDACKQHPKARVWIWK